jgi:hypothetical protein
MERGTEHSLNGLLSRYSILAPHIGLSHLEALMIASFVGLALAAQIAAGSPSGSAAPLLERVQYGFPVHRPPCGDGWDLSARDGMCYPNGYLPPQDQAARQGYYGGGGYYGGRRYPIPCGNGADLDVRDGQCYPTGTVPRRFQNRPRYYRY